MSERGGTWYFPQWEQLSKEEKRDYKVRAK